MRFLVDANMPRSTLALLASLGHIGEHARDIGLGHAPDKQIAAHARSTGAAILTRDVDFADIRNYPPHGFPAISSSLNPTACAFVLRSNDPGSHSRMMAPRKLLRQEPCHTRG